MPEIWIALTGFIILVLFWRQLVVFRLKGKINYAPLVLITGSISSVSLFIFSSGELKSDLQHAFIPMLISLIFYVVMYLMYQIRVTMSKEEQKSHERLLATLIADISGYFHVLDEKLSDIATTEEKTLEAVQLTLKNELSEFNQLSTQQKILSQKLEEMYRQEESALSRVQKFLENDVIDLDKVVHRHIDILRIAEQDHYNKLHDILNNMNDTSDNKAVSDSIDNLAESVRNMQKLFVSSVSSVSEEVRDQLALALKSMSSELQNAKQLSESLHISTQEYEMKLQELHNQASKLLEKSDTIHESMDDTFNQAQKVRPVFTSLNELISRLMDIYAEYKHAKKELHILASELGDAEERHFNIMDKKMDDLGENMHKKIDASLRELKEHYHIADRDVTSTVKTLAAKAQLQKSYSEE